MSRTRSGRPRAGRSLMAIAVVAGGLYVFQSEALLGPVHDEEAGVQSFVTGFPDHSTQPGEATGLHPGLVAALERARGEASGAGHAIPVSSGFRSIEHQLRTLDEAIEKYGTREEAEHWVFPPERSMHVRGLAIDIGDGPSADWLLTNGHRFGICQTLNWEWWHFEWRESWERSRTCPPQATKPSEAPPPDGGW